MKNNKAITLIALVITIIVLLILAGVSIALISGGNGILDKATNAVDETTKGSAKEELELYLSECKTNCYEEKYVKGASISLIDLIDQDMNRTNEKEAKNGIIKLDKENKKLIYKINDKEVAEIYIEDIGSGTSTPTVQKYSIKYNANGGENAPTDENEYENGEEVSLNFTDIPTKTDYDFLGWSTNKEATDPEYKADGTTSIEIQENDIELWAIWDAKRFYLIENGVNKVNMQFFSAGYKAANYGNISSYSIEKEGDYLKLNVIGTACVQDGIYYKTNLDKYSKFIAEDINVTKNNATNNGTHTSISVWNRLTQEGSNSDPITWNESFSADSSHKSIHLDNMVIDISAYKGEYYLVFGNYSLNYYAIDVSSKIKNLYLEK